MEERKSQVWNDMMSKWWQTLNLDYWKYVRHGLGLWCSFLSSAHSSCPPISWLEA